MARSILLILSLPYTLRFSLFEQYWALCLSSSGGDDPTGQHETLAESPFTRTSTRPPPFSTSTPCPYRTQAVGLTEPRSLVRPPGQAPGPHPSPRPPLVPTGRRQTFPIIPRFGCHKSLGANTL